MRHDLHPVILLYISLESRYIFRLLTIDAKRNETLTWCHHPNTQLFIGSGRAASPGGSGEPAEPADGQPGAGCARGIRVLFLHHQGNRGEWILLNPSPHPRSCDHSMYLFAMFEPLFHVMCYVLVACLHPDYPYHCSLFTFLTDLN